MTDTAAQAARRRMRLELLAIIATGAGHPLFESVLHLKAVYFATVGICWATYVARSVHRDRAILAEWGWRRDGLAPTARAVAAVLLIGLAGLAAIGHLLGQFRIERHLLILLLIYPVWGCVQQFLLQAFLARNLARVGLRLLPTALFTSLMFAAVHAPDWKLVAATGALGLVFTPIYLRWRNLWPLGVAHGWLGACAYYWLLGRDAWGELSR